MILLVHGPNLNTLGVREPEIYGSTTIDEINQHVIHAARARGFEVLPFQSNHEGALIDFIQEHQRDARGIVINPGALSHYGLALRDCLGALSIPVIEVHVSNIHRREAFRRTSVTAEVALACLTGFGWRGYLLATSALLDILEEASP